MTDSSKTNFQLVSIGIIGYIFVASFAYLLKFSLRDFLVNLSLKPIIIIPIVEFTYLLTFLLLLLLIFKLANDKTYNKDLILKLLVIGLIITQALQFVEPFIVRSLVDNDYYVKVTEFYDFQNNDKTMQFFTNTKFLLPSILILTIVYRKIKHSG